MRMFHISQLPLFSVLFLSLVACNSPHFTSNTPVTPAIQDVTPVTPPVTPPPVVVPPTPPPVVPPVVVVPPTPPTPPPPPPPVVVPVVKNGICNAGQNLTSCLSCPNPQAPNWVPSTKADRLASIMYMSCGIHNLSNPESFNPQQRTLEQVRSTVQACTAQVYPDSVLNAAQTSTINQLLDPNNSTMRNKIFSGLWYKPPYTDHFETYFGVYHPDIRSVMCYGADPSTTLAGFDLTTEYANACMNGTDISCSAWQNDKAAQARWNAIQTERAELRDCIGKSITMPVIKPWAPPVCDYVTFQGVYDDNAIAEVQKLESAGYTVSFQSGNSCQDLTPANSAVTAISGAPVTIAGYLCH